MTRRQPKVHEPENFSDEETRELDALLNDISVSAAMLALGRARGQMLTRAKFRELPEGEKARLADEHANRVWELRDLHERAIELYSETYTEYTKSHQEQEEA